MYHQQISISSIFLGLLIYATYSTDAEEVLIQIVVKKPINIVSDRYVSFSMNPGHLLDLCLRPSDTENATILARNLGSAYLKITGGSTEQFTLDDEQIPAIENQIRILPSDWQALHQWINRTSLKPIISLPYSSKQWSPRNIISILGISKRLGIRKCVWQLGSELNSTEAIDYVDALSTLKTMVDAFRRTGSDWSVIGADIGAGCRADEADLYAELSKYVTESIGWTQSKEYNSLEQDNNRFFETDPALRSLLRSKTPVWLNVPKSTRSLKSEICGPECQSDGIRWANTLGTSAQDGFKVVFQNVDKFDVIYPSLSYYVSLLHKKLMGTKVFDTKMMNGDNLSVKYFAHCTRNMSGSFSVMGVNAFDHQTKTSTKLPIKYTGPEMHQYILSVDNGHILFNGLPVKMDSDWQPIVKVKKPNRLTTFTLPPRSIGFWVFPSAGLQQCSIQSDTKLTSPTQPNIYNDFEHASRTATEKLLHELIDEIVQIDREINEVKRSKRHAIVKKDSRHMHRMKREASPGYKTRRAVNMFHRHPRRVARQINGFGYNNRLGKLFKNFELPQPKKFQLAKLWSRPLVTNNAITQNQAAITQNQDAIPPVTSTVHDVYNVDPNEQIFQSVENSELPTRDVLMEVGEDRNMEYVEFDGQPKKHHSQLLQNDKFADFDDDDVGDIPHSMYEFQDVARDRQRPADPAADMIPYSELWEPTVYQKAAAPQPTGQRERNDLVEGASNQEQRMDLIVTKELPPSFRENQENLMKAKIDLNEIYMNQKPANNMPSRNYDMDHDGFFVGSKRKRRSINADLNEEIEKKVNSINKAATDNGEGAHDFVEFLNKTGSKTNLLEKITKIIASLEKMEDIGKYKNIEKLTAEIRDLESFLFKRNSKAGVLKPKNRATQKEIRRKCKILSVNLEQQCLKENDFYPSRLMHRENRQTTDYKPKKVATLKNVFPPKKSDSHNRVRRNAVYETSSWEGDDRDNMIVKELHTVNEMNNFVPAISYGRSVGQKDHPYGRRKEYIQRISVLQNLPARSKTIMQVSDIVQPTDATSTVRPYTTIMQVTDTVQPTVATFTVDPSLTGRQLEADIVEDQSMHEHHSPRFMRKISDSMHDWMNIVERHVSGWWQVLS